MELRELFLGGGMHHVTATILSDNLFFGNLAAGFASLVVLLHHNKRATMHNAQRTKRPRFHDVT